MSLYVEIDPEAEPTPGKRASPLPPANEPCLLGGKGHVPQFQARVGFLDIVGLGLEHNTKRVTGGAVRSVCSRNQGSWNGTAAVNLLQ